MSNQNNNQSQKLDLPIYMYTPKNNIKEFRKEYMDALGKVLDHGLFINGPEVKELETYLAQYVGVKHCISVGNGTDAIEVALRALGIGYGDQVITVAHTWISTAEAISCVGATPVFIDIESWNFCIDPNKIEEKITEGVTKAIIVVSLYGQTPDYDSINEIASRYNLPVIEDAAQSFGAKYKNKKSCSLTTIGTTSFFPSKPLGGFGDGGACFTNNDELASKISAIKNHGCLQRFNHMITGRNSRLDTIQAALLKLKYEQLDSSLVKRNKVAKFYNDKLKQLQSDDLCQLPMTDKDNYHVWAQYSILLNSNEIRDKVFNELKNYKIFPAIFYPKPLHTQKCYDHLGYAPEDLPITIDVCDRIINLPCYAELEEKEQQYVCDVFIDLVKKFSNL